MYFYNYLRANVNTIGLHLAALWSNESDAGTAQGSRSGSMTFCQPTCRGDLDGDGDAERMYENR